MAEPTTPPLGEQIKAAQNGSGPLLTVEQIMDRAPKDLREEIVEIPEWGGKVRIKSYTAAQAAQIKQKGAFYKGEDLNVAWAEMEITQFQQAVVEPRFSEDQVRQLHLVSGRGFSRVIAAIDEMTGTDKEELRKAQQEFQVGNE